MKKLVMLFLVALMSGCSTMGSNVTTFEQYRTMDQVKREGYLKEVDAKVVDKVTYDAAQEKLLVAGLPVHLTVDNVKMSKVWDRQARKLSFYEGYVTSAFGSESLLILSILTEPNSPTPLLSLNKATGKPEYTVLAGNVSVQETMARAVVKSVVGPAFNGIGSALVMRSGCKDCGAITINNDSKATTSTMTNIDLGCINCTNPTP